MTARLRPALRWLGEFFDVVKPEPIRLNCGDVDDGPRYVRGCGHTVCEQHRLAEHDCGPEGVSP
jgi:hypothetical protein